MFSRPTTLQLLLLTIVACQNIDQFSNYLEDQFDKARHYQLPTDNSEYKPIEDSIKEYGTFDFIIVGAGAGGTVVANRLSEISSWKILLIDAGTYGDNFTEVPSSYSAVDFTPYNWGYKSTPQNTSCLGMVDHQCELPRGKGIGGTTLINGLIYSRGHFIDYDRWSAIGNPGWSYKDVLPYFKKAEKFNPRPPVTEIFRPEYHGTKGYLNVEYHKPTHPQLVQFLAANKEIGVRTDDYNANILCAAPCQLNTKNGRRCDGGTAYIAPIQRKRCNLKVLTNSLVTRILFDGKTATGIQFSRNQKLYTAKATKEVIVSAGTYNTPQLLMLSGIGPQKHLQDMDIPVVENLEVGSKLKDHPMYFGLTFSTNLTNPIRAFQEYVREFVNGTGPFTSPGGNDGIAFYESSYTNGTGYPDIELVMKTSNATNDFIGPAFGLTNSSLDALWSTTNPANSFIFYVIVLHGQSSGTVRLQSNSPYDFPLIDTKFLSDAKGHDIDVMFQGVQIALKLTQTEAFRKINTTIATHPFEECRQFGELYSKEYIMCSIRMATTHVYHPVSTCPMGPRPLEGDVVDARLKVHGLKRLRVIDASVFPFTLAGHPNAATVMVAEKGSDLIKQDHGQLTN